MNTETETKMTLTEEVEERMMKMNDDELMPEEYNGRSIIECCNIVKAKPERCMKPVEKKFVRFVPSRSGNVPFIRHAPPVTAAVGLKGSFQIDDFSKPMLSQVCISKKVERKKHLSVASLRLLPVSIYDESSPYYEPEESPLCPICLDIYKDGDEIRSLDCLHCFHKRCIDIWLLGYMLTDEMDTCKCPQCRHAIAAPENEDSDGIPSLSYLRIGQSMSNTGNEDDSSPALGFHRSSNGSISTTSNLSRSVSLLLEHLNPQWNMEEQEVVETEGEASVEIARTVRQG